MAIQGLNTNKWKDGMTLILEKFHPIHWDKDYIMLDEDVQKNHLWLRYAHKTYNAIIKFIESQLTTQEKKLIKTHLYRKLPNEKVPIENLGAIKQSNVGFSFSVYQEIKDKKCKLDVLICDKAIYPNIIAAYEDDIDTLILPYLHNSPNILDLQAIKEIYTSSGMVIHELAHWLDDLQFDLHNVPPQEYYNSDSELNAFTLQLIDFLRTIALSGRGKNNETTLKEIMPFTSPNFIENLIKDIKDDNFGYDGNLKYNMIGRILETFYNALTDENRKKVIKRVCQYFQDIISKYQTRESRMEALAN